MGFVILLGVIAYGVGVVHAIGMGGVTAFVCAVLGVAAIIAGALGNRAPEYVYAPASWVNGQTVPAERVLVHSGRRWPGWAGLALAVALPWAVKALAM